MRRERFLPLLFLAVALLFFRGSLFLGRAEIPCNPNRWLPWRLHASPEEIAPPAVNTDCALAYYPRRLFATEWMRKGDLPLWDPTTFTGQPFLANFQSALLYPVNLLLYAIDPLRAMGWFVAIHLFLAGLFFYFAARTFGMARGPAAAAAVVFELNPFFLTRTGHPTFLATGAYLPLVIAAGARLVARPTGVRTAHLALALALATLAGFPQTLIHIEYALAFFALLSLVTIDGRRRGKVALAFAAALLLSLLLAAFQLLPTAEFLRHSTRGAVDLAGFRSGTHHPAMLLRMIVPDLFGNPMREDLWSTLFRTGNGLFRQNYVSTIGYFGVLPLVVGVYGIATARRRLFLAGLFLLPLLVVWGTPFADLAWHLPGFRFSRPDRLVLLPLFAAAVGFGFGLERIVAVRRAPRAVIAGFLLFALAAGAIALFRAPLVRALLAGRLPLSGEIVPLPRGAVPLGKLTGAALVSALTTEVIALLALVLFALRRRLGRRAFPIGIALLAAGDLYLFGSRFHLDLPAGALFRETPEIGAIRRATAPRGRIARFGPAAADLLPPATASLFGIDDVAGINALNLERYRVLMDALEPGLYAYRRYRPFHRLASVSSPIARLVGARVFGVDDSGRLLAMPGTEPLPRVSLHRSWAYLPGDEILQRLRAPGFDPAAELFLEGEGPDPPVAPGTGSADITVYGPDRVAVRAATTTAAFLLLTDAWFPGWEARVDGEAAEIHRADYAFRAVHVPPGEHVVDFRYRPASFRIGALLSTGALLVVVALFAAGRKRRFA